jgi:hypothetical protein
MKAIIFNIILIVSISCTNTDIQTVSEETEYQNFLAARSAEFSQTKMPTPIERNRMFERAYDESGLKRLVGSSLQQGAPVPVLSEINKFYDDVIVGKYSGHISQGKLKLAFVSYAVRSLGLTNPENLNAKSKKDFLVKLTRDIVALNGDTRPELAYECLSASKELFEKNEFNRMVMKSKFQARFNLEQMQKNMAEAKDSDNKELVDQVDFFIKMCEKNLIDLEALKMM